MSKEQGKLRYTLASLGLVSILALSGCGSGLGDTGAEEMDVTYITQDTESEEVKGIPVIQYLVVGGEPRDIEYEVKESDRINYYINNSEEEFEVKGLKDITDSAMDTVYSDISKDISVNSVVDFGHIGVKGNLTQNSEDLIKLGVEGAVTEHLAKYDSKTDTFSLVEEREGELSEEDLKGNDYALIAFIDKFESESEESEDSKESTDEDSKEGNSEESEESKDTEDESVEEPTEEESTEEESTEEDTEEEPTEEEPTEEDTEEETEEGNEESVEDGEEKEESDKSEESEVSDEDSETESDVEDEVDTSAEAGTETFLGDVFEIGKSGFEENEDDVTLFVSPEQLEYLQEFVDKGIEEHDFYKDNEITSAQELYEKFGLYNISEEIAWLYVPELDENGDGIMGNVSGEDVVSWVEILDKYVPEDSTGGATGEGSVDPDEPTLDEIMDNIEEYDPEEDVDLPEGGTVGESDEVYDPEELENEELEVEEGEDIDVEIGDIDYGSVVEEEPNGEVVESGGNVSSDGSDGSKGSNGSNESEEDNTVEEITVDLEDNLIDSFSGYDIRVDENGSISEVYNEDGERIAYRDVNGNLVYELYESHPDRVSFEKRLSEGEVVVEDSEGNTAKVSEEGKVLPDTGMDVNYVVPVGIGVILIGGVVLFLSRRKRKED